MCAPGVGEDIDTAYYCDIFVWQYGIITQTPFINIFLLYILLLLQKKKQFFWQLTQSARYILLQ